MNNNGIAQQQQQQPPQPQVIPPLRRHGGDRPQKDLKYLFAFLFLMLFNLETLGTLLLSGVLFWLMSNLYYQGVKSAILNIVGMNSLKEFAIPFGPGLWSLYYGLQLHRVYGKLQTMIFANNNGQDQHRRINNNPHRDIDQVFYPPGHRIYYNNDHHDHELRQEFNNNNNNANQEEQNQNQNQRQVPPPAPRLEFIDLFQDLLAGVTIRYIPLLVIIAICPLYSIPFAIVSTILSQGELFLFTWITNVVSSHYHLASSLAGEPLVFAVGGGVINDANVFNQRREQLLRENGEKKKILASRFWRFSLRATFALSALACIATAGAGFCFYHAFLLGFSGATVPPPPLSRQENHYEQSSSASSSSPDDFYHNFHNGQSEVDSYFNYYHKSTSQKPPKQQNPNKKMEEQIQDQEDPLLGRAAKIIQTRIVQNRNKYLDSISKSVEKLSRIRKMQHERENKAAENNKNEEEYKNRLRFTINQKLHQMTISEQENARLLEELSLFRIDAARHPAYQFITSNIPSLDVLNVAGAHQFQRHFLFNEIFPASAVVDSDKSEEQIALEKKRRIVFTKSSLKKKKEDGDESNDFSEEEGDVFVRNLREDRFFDIDENEEFIEEQLEKNWQEKLGTKSGDENKKKQKINTNGQEDQEQEEEEESKSLVLVFLQSILDVIVGTIDILLSTVPAPSTFSRLSLSYFFHSSSQSTEANNKTTSTPTNLNYVPPYFKRIFYGVATQEHLSTALALLLIDFLSIAIRTWMDLAQTIFVIFVAQRPNFPEYGDREFFVPKILHRLLCTAFTTVFASQACGYSPIVLLKGFVKVLDFLFSKFVLGLFSSSGYSSCSQYYAGHHFASSSSTTTTPHKMLKFGHQACLNIGGYLYRYQHVDTSSFFSSSSASRSGGSSTRTPSSPSYYPDSFFDNLDPSNIINTQNEFINNVFSSPPTAGSYLSTVSALATGYFDGTASSGTSGQDKSWLFSQNSPAILPWYWQFAFIIFVIAYFDIMIDYAEWRSVMDSFKDLTPALLRQEVINRRMRARARQEEERLARRSLDVVREAERRVSVERNDNNNNDNNSRSRSNSRSLSVGARSRSPSLVAHPYQHHPQENNINNLNQQPDQNNNNNNNRNRSISNLSHVSDVLDLQCLICLDDIDKNTLQDAKILPCGHIFHGKCLTRSYAMVNTNCPACRQPMMMRNGGNNNNQ